MIDFSAALTLGFLLFVTSVSMSSPIRVMVELSYVFSDCAGVKAEANDRFERSKRRNKGTSSLIRSNGSTRLTRNARRSPGSLSALLKEYDAESEQKK